MVVDSILLHCGVLLRCAGREVHASTAVKPKKMTLSLVGGANQCRANLGSVSNIAVRPTIKFQFLEPISALTLPSLHEPEPERGSLNRLHNVLVQVIRVTQDPAAATSWSPDEQQRLGLPTQEFTSSSLGARRVSGYLTSHLVPKRSTSPICLQLHRQAYVVRGASPLAGLISFQRNLSTSPDGATPANNINTSTTRCSNVETNSNWSLKIGAKQAAAFKSRTSPQWCCQLAAAISSGVVAVGCLSYGFYQLALFFFYCPAIVEIVWDVIKDDEWLIEQLGSPLHLQKSSWGGYQGAEEARISFSIIGSKPGRSGCIHADVIRALDGVGWDIVSIRFGRTDAEAVQEGTGVVAHCPANGNPLRSWISSQSAEIGQSGPIFTSSNGPGTRETAVPMHMYGNKMKMAERSPSVALTDDIRAPLQGYSIPDRKGSHSSPQACPYSHST